MTLRPTVVRADRGGVPPTVLVAGAVLADAVVAAADPTGTPVPVVTLAAVVAVGLARGARAGALAGAAVGVVLDLLAGPAALAGAATLVAVALGALGGAAGGGVRDGYGGGLLVGGALVPVGAAVHVLLPALDGRAPVPPSPAVLAVALGVGLTATPVLRRWCRSTAPLAVPN